MEEVEGADNNTDVEISKGQSPTSTFTIPNLKMPFDHICKVPGSTRLLGTVNSQSTSDASYGIHGFDVTKPESGATIIGLGLGTSVNDLVVHEVRLSFDSLWIHPQSNFQIRRRFLSSSSRQAGTT